MRLLRRFLPFSGGCVSRRYTTTAAAQAQAAAANIILRSMQQAPNGFVAGSRATDVMVVADPPSRRCPLGRTLLDGYRRFFQSHAALSASFVDFEPTDFMQTHVQAVIDDAWAQRGGPPGAAALPPDAHVVAVLIQSGAFQNQLQAYRLRLRLFERGFRVVEHGHLDTLTPSTDSVAMCSRKPEGSFGACGGCDAVENTLRSEDPADEKEEVDAVVAQQRAPVSTPSNEAEVTRVYLGACGVDPVECDVEGRRIATAIDAVSASWTPETTTLVIASAGNNELTYGGPLETCLLNTGLMKSKVSGPDNIGCSYPFGEVITEAVRLTDVSGTAAIFAYPNLQRRMVLAPAPFTITIDQGVVVGTGEGTPADFIELLGLIRSVEGEVAVRELGIGLNTAMGRGAMLPDVTAFERQRGIHLSIGKRHPLFPKVLPGGKTSTGQRPPPRGGLDSLRRKDGKFHIDIFVDATALYTCSATGREALLRYA